MSHNKLKLIVLIISYIRYCRICRNRNCNCLTIIQGLPFVCSYCNISVDFTIISENIIPVLLAIIPNQCEVTILVSS